MSVPLITDQRIKRVLCVDLDGSLIASDLLWESFVSVMRRQPATLLLIPFWLPRGRAYLKRQLADRAQLDFETIPIREEVHQFLQNRHEAGQKIVLVTAADDMLARPLAARLGLFDEVLASDGVKNLKGETKLEVIQERFGEVGFDYVGDSKSDLPIWEAAKQAIVVDPSEGLLNKARARNSSCEVLGRSETKISDYLRLIRVHQWAKNLLLFVPLLTSHQVAQLPLLLAALIAFLAFSMGASAVYVLNDLVDLPSDRRHPRKQKRPLASGLVSIPVALSLVVALLLSSLVLAGFLPLPFAGMLLLYLGVTTAYSFYFKKKLVVDVICLAGLYTLRVLAGGAATGIEISPWLLAFSMFFFLSLAFVKRYTELDSHKRVRGRISSRGYMAVDRSLIRSVGPACGLLAISVLALYINSPDVTPLYRRPMFLWLLNPLFLYWIMRVWFLAQRRQMPDDPVLFALKDRISLLVGVIALVIVFLAT